MNTDSQKFEVSNIEGAGCLAYGPHEPQFGARKNGAIALVHRRYVGNEDVVHFAMPGWLAACVSIAGQSRRRTVDEGTAMLR